MRARIIGFAAAFSIALGCFLLPVVSDAQVSANPAHKQQADKLAKERMEMQLKMAAQRRQEEQARAKQLREAQRVNVAPKTGGNQPVAPARPVK